MKLQTTCELRLSTDPMIWSSVQAEKYFLEVINMGQSMEIPCLSETVNMTQNNDATSWYALLILKQKRKLLENSPSEKCFWAVVVNRWFRESDEKYMTSALVLDHMSNLNRWLL